MPDVERGGSPWLFPARSEAGPNACEPPRGNARPSGLMAALYWRLRHSPEGTLYCIAWGAVLDFATRVWGYTRPLIAGGQPARSSQGGTKCTDE